MTIDEFLERLAGLKMTWHLDHGAIRCDGHCPISAVIGDKSAYGAAIDVGEIALGLGRTNARAIVHSADACGRYKSIDLRSRLLKACGLEEMT